MIFNMVEVEISKDTHQNAAKVLNTLLEAGVDKVDSLVSVQVEMRRRSEGCNEFELMLSTDTTHYIFVCSF